MKIFNLNYIFVLCKDGTSYLYSIYNLNNSIKVQKIEINYMSSSTPANGNVVISNLSNTIYFLNNGDLILIELFPFQNNIMAADCSFLKSTTDGSIQYLISFWPVIQCPLIRILK